MSIVSRYHSCQLQVWVQSEPERGRARPIFLNVFRQPITTCLRCGQLLALEDLQETMRAPSAALEQAQPAELAFAYAG